MFMYKRGYFVSLILSVYVFYFCPLAHAANVDSKGKSEALATVNGEAITMDDYYNSFQDRAPMPPGMQKESENPQRIKRYLDKAIEHKLLLQEALKMEIDKDPLIVRRVNELQKRLLIDAFYKKITATELDDEKLEKYYKDNKKKYTKETVRASHILVKTESDAKNILKQLNEGGNFEMIAKNSSLDPSGGKGGDLVFIARGQMAPEFDKALFGLKKTGDISPVVKTRFGYHIIKLTGELQQNTEPFSKVKSIIRRELEKELLKNYIDKLKTQSKISISEQYR